MAQNIVRADIEPQCLGAQSINNLLKKMQNDIIVKGYITTRVLTPSQNLKSGNLVITLIPGRVRHIRFIDTADQASPWRSQLWNIYPNDVNDLVNLRRVEQALENMKRVPTVNAKIQIAPSEPIGTDVASVGDSDLLVAWQQGRPVRLQMNIDDSGTKQTGKYLASTTLSLDNPFHLNDLFYINYTHDLGGTDSGSRGTHGYSGYYSIPLGFSLLTLTSSQNEYHQTVFGNTQNYIYSGDTENKAIKLSHVVYRDAFNKTTIEAGGWTRSCKNQRDNKKY
jgi:hemolysin activation/secretion protein